MEQAVLAGGAMTTHVENAIYLGSLWILIKFLRWRSNHCGGGGSYQSGGDDATHTYVTRNQIVQRGGDMTHHQNPTGVPYHVQFFLSGLTTTPTLIGDLTFLVYFVKHIQDRL